MKRTTPMRQPATAALETLESRELLAGNVMADKSGTDLVITGDGSSNGVMVRQVDHDSFRIIGVTHLGSATRVNGVGNASQTIDAISGNIVIRMGAGHDWLDVSGTSSANLVAPGDLDIYGGTGNDSTTIKRIFTKDDLYVNTGTGRDDTTIYKTTTNDDMTVYSPATSKWTDRDRVWVTESGVGLGVYGLLDIDLAMGDDQVYLTRTNASEMSVYLYGGDDYLSVRGGLIWSHRGTFNGGADNDGLNMTGFDMLGYPLSISGFERRTSLA